ncbi:MAG: GntR family transcriptional regulator, partial [Verrucomicrobiales bacterium]|nr:GntR family transcriptional regulator [Verrucomicrobiales bacterium]
MNKKSNTMLSQIGSRTADSPISWLMKTKLERPNLVSLAAGFTDNESLPLVSSRRLLNEILKNEEAGRSALQYGSTAGDDILRKLTAMRIEQLDKISKNTKTSGLAKRMVITHGSQQFLYILTEALCDPGDIVLV